jgi:hypothetical protein
MYILHLQNEAVILSGRQKSQCSQNFLVPKKISTHKLLLCVEKKNDPEEKKSDHITWSEDFPASVSETTMGLKLELGLEKTNRCIIDEQFE